MGTRFELLLYGDDVAGLRAAGEEAVAEINRLHDQLSLFRDQSAISRVNRKAADGPVRVNAELFYLLSRVERLVEISGGAFDVTVGPLMRLWGFRGDDRAAIDENKIRDTLGRIGFKRISLDRRTRTVAFATTGMELDLGGVAKGYALDVAADLLQQVGVECGLLHGGTSTVRAIGTNPDGEPWKVAVKGIDEAEAYVGLVDEAMSVSAVSGRVIVDDDKEFGHVLDPRTGRPVDEAELAVVVLPTAMDADALSTGLLVLGPSGLGELNTYVVGFRAAVVAHGRLHQHGDPIQYQPT